MLRLIFLLIFVTGAAELCKAQVTREVTMCQGDTAIMSAVVADADSMRWFYNNQPVADATNDTLRSVRSGLYYLAAYSGGGKCFEQSDFIRVNISYPAARDDNYALTPGRTEALNVLNNDDPACSAFNLSTITITHEPLIGNIVSVTNGKILYKASSNLLVPDNFSYRITDMEGRTTNEATVRIEVVLNCAMIYPNPVKDIVNVIVDPKRVHAINVYDAGGKRVASMSADRTDMKLDMTRYAQGIYIFEIEERNGEGCTLKVQKDK